MGQLASSIRRLFSGTMEMKILMVGLDAAGKTTILYKIQLGEAVHTIPTVGFNVETVHHRGNNVTVWDIGGQDKLRALWRHYYANNDAIVFVVDCADESRLDIAREELTKLLTTDELRTSVLLVFANKQDLPGALTTAQLVERLCLMEVRNREWFVQGCSAVSGDGLFEGFDWVTGAVKRARAHHESRF